MSWSNAVVGMVNAALCAQVLITSFSTDAVINTGIAGSLDPNIDIGDVVLSTDSVNHIMDVQNLGYEPGQTPGIEVAAYPASETLRNAAKSAASRLDLTAHEGRVASGDRFVREEKRKRTDQNSIWGKLLRNGRRSDCSNLLSERGTLFNSACDLGQS